MVRQEAPGGELSPLQAVLAADTVRESLLAEAKSATDPVRIAELHQRLVEIGADAAPSRAARILKGLGFDDAAQAQPLSSFSGGWRMRVALAGVLFLEPDLLLLDEPTNHLDLEAAIWLEEHLRRYPRTLILVSHDRDFLNSVPQKTCHLEGRKLTLYAGGYDQFERTRRERLVLAEKARERQVAERAHIQSFVDRFRYKASKARQAQSRLKMLERMEPIAQALIEPEIRFSFPAGSVPAPPMITMEGARAGYGEKTVLSGLDLRLDPDDRIALLGRNGNGKSTFAKLVAGRLEPMAGELVRARGLRVGFFAQHQIEDLVPEETPLQHIQIRRPEQREQQTRAWLARFGLGQDQARTRARHLSGGEKTRLALALMCLDAPQLLILDEPTNHLDIDSREALVEAVNEFPGAVIVISHDRHLVELVADSLWLVADGKVRPYDGDMDDYRQLLLETSAEPTAPGARQARPPRRRRAPLAPGAPPPAGEGGRAHHRAPRPGARYARDPPRRPSQLRQRHRHRRAPEAPGRAQGPDRGGRAPLAGSRRRDRTRGGIASIGLNAGTLGLSPRAGTSPLPSTPSPGLRWRHTCRIAIRPGSARRRGSLVPDTSWHTKISCQWSEPNKRPLSWRRHLPCNPAPRFSTCPAATVATRSRLQSVATA